MKKPLFQRISAMTDRSEFGYWLDFNGFSGRGVEIGVAYGENASHILEGYKGHLFLIDPYDLSRCGEYIDGSSKIDFKGALNYARTLLSPHKNYTLILDTSDVALSLFEDESLDFVYLDGNHHNPQISNDLWQWWNKVRIGGVFGGHDYYDLDTPAFRCEVKKSVDLFARKKKLQIHTTGDMGTSWWTVKEKQ